MKKLIVFVFVFFFSACEIFSQDAGAYKTKWEWGGGLTYSRFMKLDATSYGKNTNAGSQFFLGFSPNEYISFDVNLNYLHLESVYDNTQTQKLNLMSLNLSALYEFIPCRAVSPFLILGLGPDAYASSNPFESEYKSFHYGWQAFFGLGFNWQISNSLFLRFPIEYHLSSNSEIEGRTDITESNDVFGNTRSFMTASVNIGWNFGFGEKSDLCKSCPSGIREIIHDNNNYYHEVEHDTIIVDKTLLLPVHFKFDKWTLKDLSKDFNAIWILNYDIEQLNKNPKIDVVVSGNADSIGTESYNLNLSKKRALTVYNYLFSHGINSSRIGMTYFGEDKPIRDNGTSLGRAYNRRAELNVLGSPAANNK